MTEKLKTLLHEQAETVDFALPDLESLTRTGDRRIRRRRATGLVGGVAALAVVGGLAVTQLGGSDDVRRDATPAGDPASTARVTWAEGSVLHWPGGSTDLGHPVRAYLPTEVGYVFTDGDGAVWSAVDGVVDRVGGIESRSPRLVADHDGSLAAWVDPLGPRPRVVVLDQATGETRFFDATELETLAAIDGDTLYGQAGRRATSLDLASGETRPVDVPRGAEIRAVEDGVIVSDGGYDDGGLAANDGDLVTRPDGEVVTLHQAYGDTATFSPDARWVSIDADEPKVFDTTTGQQVDIDVAGRVFATGFEWLAPDTLVMIASKNETGPVELLTCTVPAGTCASTVPDLGSFADLAASFALPVGIELED